MRRILRDDMGMIQAFTQDIPDVDVYEVVLKEEKLARRRGFNFLLRLKNERFCG